MLSEVITAPAVRHIRSRGYAQFATAAKLNPRTESSVLSTKLFVAALDNGSPVSRITVAFKAGSRYEPSTELGLSHALRSAAGLTTRNSSYFLNSRKLAQIGATFSTTGDREFVYYTLEVTQVHLLKAIEQLQNIVSNQEFRPWELKANIPRMQFDIGTLTPQIRTVDLLHKAAFRRGLGNSLFMTPKRQSSFDAESLQHFACSTLISSRCAISVVGNSKEIALLLAKNMELPCSNCPDGPSSVYYGGELRKETGGELAHVAIAMQGAPAGSPKSIALAVAAKALGNGPVTKWGCDNTVLAKTVGNIGSFAAAGFNVSYSDDGLFGVLLTVPKDDAAVACKNVAGFLKSPNLSSDAIKAGKNLLKLQVLSAAEDGSQLCQSIAAQGLYFGCVRSPVEVVDDIDKLSDSEINEALSSAAGTNISMSAVGNLAFVPYINEL